MMRSETDVKALREVFVNAGDHPPAISTAVVDTLAWVLGDIPTEELTEQYLVTGNGYRCFTCPAGGSP